MRIRLRSIIMVVLIFCCTAPAPAAAAPDDTLLMFVGEDLSVVTAASRKPESPSSAPAVVDVVTRETIVNRGYRTLGELLSLESGFYISKGARGSVPYLRGLPESILFLYNGIPLPSGGTKNIQFLDYELSLDSVKQVEIIRGPGSVLWGPDAFAGIVNIVPLDADESGGATVELTAGSHKEKSAYAAYGGQAENIRTFLSVRQSFRQYHDRTYRVYSVTDKGALAAFPGKVDDSDYVEVTAQGSVGDGLTFTGRFSDFTREYSVEDAAGFRWKGTKETPVSCLGVSANTGMGKSHLKFSAYYQNMSFLLRDMNTEYEEDLDQYYGEILWDRRFFRKGLLTAGFSYKQSQVDGALAEGGFVPEEVRSPFPLFNQAINQTDYHTRLRSVFAQYRHQAGSACFWAGARLDSHSEYSTDTSWSLGVNWNASDAWRFKAVMGSAYRTPYSQQVYEGIAEQSDEIDTYSLQAEFSPNDRFRMDLTTFYSSVSGYVSSDPYGGASQPASRDIYGGELSAALSWSPVKIFMNLSALNSSGADYRFRIEDYTLVNPDGTVETYYETWAEPFDTAPEFLFNVGGDWHISETTGLSAMISYTDPVKFSYAKNTAAGKYSEYWLVDATFTRDDFLRQNFRFRCGVKNLFDSSYDLAGYYGPVPGPGRTWFFQWGLTW